MREESLPCVVMELPTGLTSDWGAGCAGEGQDAAGTDSSGCPWVGGVVVRRLAPIQAAPVLRAGWAAATSLPGWLGIPRAPHCPGAC